MGVEVNQKFMEESIVKIIRILPPPLMSLVPFVSTTDGIATIPLPKNLLNFESKETHEIISQSINKFVFGIEPLVVGSEGYI